MKSLLINIIALSFISSSLWAGPVTDYTWDKGKGIGCAKFGSKKTGDGAHVAGVVGVKDVKAKVVKDVTADENL